MFWWNLALCWITFLAVLMLLLRTEPQFSGFRYWKDVESTQWTSVSLPLSISTATPVVRTHVNVLLEPLHSDRLRLTSNRCITEMWMNGTRVTSLPSPFCPTTKTPIDLGPYLNAGMNDMALVLSNTGKNVTLNITSDRHAPLFIVWGLILTALLLAGSYHLYHAFGAPKRHAPLFVIFAAGTALRAFYVLMAPFSFLSYDWWGHLDYVRYVLTNFAIPPANGGWQFYHPPLYYFLAAAWSWTGWSFGDKDHVVVDLQGLSFVLSVATLAISLWIALLLFPKEQERKERFGFATFLAFFPGIVFFTSRVSNDVLLMSLSFLMFAFLLRWWRSSHTGDWILTSVCIGLGLLTKSNALPLLAIAWTCLLFKPAFHWRNKVNLAAVSALAVIAIYAWLPLVRGSPGSPSLVGNDVNVNLRVEATASNLFAFNPWQILQHPYNNTWSDSRRGNLWEFLLRSAFTGEFDFGNNMKLPDQILLTLSFAALLLIVCGLVRECLRNFTETVPLASTLVILLGSMFLFRILSPYTPSQDFRYVPLVAVPAGFYAMRGTLILPAIWKRAASYVLLTIVILCALLLILMFQRWW